MQFVNYDCNKKGCHPEKYRQGEIEGKGKDKKTVKV